MKGKLVKIEDGYELLTQGFLKGSTNHKLIDSLNVEEGNIRYKLSLKNCQAVERGYDLDKIFQREIDELMFTWNLDDPSEYRSGMYKGADILLKLMGDKKFSEDDMIRFMQFIISQETLDNASSVSTVTAKYYLDNFQSLQQTEWEVEVVTENVCGRCYSNNTNECWSVKECSDGKYDYSKPLLDADGCLILKRI